jgi:hypothetical protein
MRLVAEIALYLFAVNGLFRVIGLPAIRDWFRHPKSCVFCNGTGRVFPHPRTVVREDSDEG